MAIDARVGLLNRWWMVAFCIEFRGYLQDRPRAIFDAIPAAFAPVFNYVDYPLGNQDLFGVQWNSPIFHFIIVLPADFCRVQFSWGDSRRSDE